MVVMDLREASILTDEKNLQQLEAVCRNRFGRSPEADECYLYILDKCQEDDFRRLRLFSGKSSLKTYLYTLFNNLAADFMRSRYGRRRLPKLVSDLGAWAEAVYKLVCWQKYSYEDAWEIVSLKDLYDKPFNHFLDDIEELNRVPCPEHLSFVSTDYEDYQEPADSRSRSNPLEALLRRLDLERRLQAARIIKNHTAALPPEDQLLIRLVYGDNHSIGAAGRLLGFYPVRAQRRMKKLLVGIREALLAEGIREW